MPAFRTARVYNAPFAARAAMALVALFAAALLLLPASPAYADGYSVEGVDMSATVRRDGSLEVVERRTFEFDGEVNGVYWTIPHATNQQGGGSAVAVDDVVRVDEGGERRFGRASAAEKGEDGVYTVEEGDASTTLMVFSPAEDESVTFQISYTLTGAVMAWGDTGELYWQFVGPEWEEPSRNVSLDVRFDGAPGAYEAGDGLRAWAHGSLDGTVRIDGAAVAYHVPEVRPGEYAEARVAFPTSWVSYLEPAAEDRLQTIVDEEAAWAAEANARREQARVALTVLRVVCIGGSADFAVAAWIAR